MGLGSRPWGGLAVKWLVQLLAAVFALALLPLLQQEAYSWCWHLAQWVMRSAAQCLPKEMRDERQRECDADLYQLKDRRLTALIWALGTLIHAPNLGRIEAGLPSVQYSISKRAYDLIVASLVLILALPLIAIIALAIRLGSPGPVIFRLRRVGRDGREITIHKFRVMHTGNNIRLPLATEGEALLLPSSRDPRITPVGRVLRRLSLDELPLVFDVLSGDLSVVGPRPLSPFELESYTAEQREVLKATPGMTPPMDLRRPFPRSREERIQNDLEYVRKRSFLVDLKIIFFSVIVSFRRRS